jgi:hypothetical protein
MNSHLAPQQMLAYLDGELSRSEMRRIDGHLHSCWTCRSEVERLKADIATILDAQTESFSPSLPPPPRPWVSFDALLARSLPEQSPSPWVRMAVYMRLLLSPMRVFVSSAVVAALMIFGYSVFRSKPVSAMEVLRRVQAADTKRSVITKNQVILERIHIRKSTRGQNRPQLANVDTWKSRTTAYWNMHEGDAASVDLKAQYKAHDIPVDLPLSAASINSWGRAAGGTPIVSQQGSDMDVSFAGSSGGVEGSIERVSLIVQPQTWQVKQMTLQFPDASFEITEDDFSVVPTSTVPTELLAYLEPESVPLVAITPAIHSFAGAGPIHLPMVNLDKAALDVFATLHHLHADLGEPVTVIRSDRDVQVGVWQLSADRQNELRAVFAGTPGVQVELTPPHMPSKTAAVAKAAAPPPLSPDSLLHIEVDSTDDDRLFKYFGSADKEQEFTSQALATSTAILSHLYALRNLQSQFPADKEEVLAPEERTQLNALVQDHATAISANLDTLRTQLAPLDANFNVVPSTSSVNAVLANWQSGSLEALETARVIDHVLRALLTTSQTSAAPDVALPQIDQNLSRLRAELKNFAPAMH